MLVTTKVLLQGVKQKGYAIPAPNFIDIDSMRLYLEVAEDFYKSQLFYLWLKAISIEFHLKKLH
ncbi:TPA: hypothetical protein QFF48_000558 [Enterococcus faecium]